MHILSLLAQQKADDAAAAAVGGVFVLGWFACMCFIVVLSLLALAFQIWMLIDAVQNPALGDNTFIWILVIVLGGAIDAAVYYFVGRKANQ
jgi:hypothetical protein